MNETERNQIKGALLKCAEENQNKIVCTGCVVISSVCKAAAERIEELEKANATLSSMNETMWVEIEKKRAESQGITNKLHQLAKLEDLLNKVKEGKAKWVDYDAGEDANEDIHEGHWEIQE